MTTTAAPAGWLSSYQAPPGGYDEMVARDGRVRDAWAGVATALDEMGVAELRQRHRDAVRLLRNDGVTYNVYGHGVTYASDWSLDPIPLLIGSGEWAAIEHAVTQRAELLDLLLADLYGPRELIRKGIIPVEVVAGHPGFLRSCDRVGLPGERQLLSYACDLVRDPSGQVRVLSDFAQAPSGSGYALENRMVTSRVFPSLYREAQVHRLAPFFRSMRAALNAAGPEGIDDPRVAMLTPGPFSETYFEHAYLATYLGYPLVEGSDLTVKEGRLWLRSLTGLERVDVLVRRVDGWYCDPLELKSDSRLGVPGLVEVARRGGVSVANPIGAAILENPGLLPFLPRVAEHLLGQPLELPSVTTWWCGTPAERSHVLAHLGELVVRPIGQRESRDDIHGWDLDEAGRDALRRRIEAKPMAFVAQEAVAFSSVPCLASDRVEGRPVVLRSFAVARDGSYNVMPGGLARVASLPEERGWSGLAGGLSKDTWVLASEPEPQSGLWLNRGPGLAALDPARAMPARVAENLFWLGRYAERAEATVRLVRAILDRRNDFASGLNEPGAECLLGLFVALTRLSGTTDVEAAVSDELDHGLLAVVSDPGRTGSLAYTLQALLSAIQGVRDQMSADTWLVVADLERQLEALDTRRVDPYATLPAVLGDVIRSLLALQGLASESMVRDPGWQFMDAGRRLERAMLLVSLVRSTVVPVRGVGAESLMLESLLVAGESIITYRRLYRSRAQVETVLDLLLLEPDNPRSLAYQLDQLTEGVSALPRPSQVRLSDEERLVLEVSTMLRVADTAGLAQPSQSDPTLRLSLDDLLVAIETLLAHAAEAIERSHFSRPEEGRLLVAGRSVSLGEPLASSMP
jgi:uncharacterized circularly permuted ATP-grasp superfamily protein/uncharacterized alpha-E superfamily protein